MKADAEISLCHEEACWKYEAEGDLRDQQEAVDTSSRKFVRIVRQKTKDGIGQGYHEGESQKDLAVRCVFLEMYDIWWFTRRRQSHLDAMNIGNDSQYLAP